MTFAATRTALTLNPLLAQSMGMAMGLARQSQALALATFSVQQHPAAVSITLSVTAIPLERSAAVAYASAPKLRASAPVIAAATAPSDATAELPIAPRNAACTDPRQRPAAQRPEAGGGSQPQPIAAVALEEIPAGPVTNSVAGATAPLAAFGHANDSPRPVAAGSIAPQQPVAQPPRATVRQHFSRDAAAPKTEPRQPRSEGTSLGSRPRTPWQHLPRSLFAPLQATAAIGRRLEAAPRALKRLVASALRMHDAAARETTPGIEKRENGTDRAKGASPAAVVAQASPLFPIAQDSGGQEGAPTLAATATPVATAPAPAEVKAPSPWERIAPTTVDALVFGLSQAGGEAAPDESFQGHELTYAERLTEALLTQLNAGPGALASELFLARFNAGLQAGEARLSREHWTDALRAALRIAVRHTPLFDEGGSRMLAEIQADASRILGIPAATFIDWEGPLQFEPVTAQLFSDRGRDDLPAEIISGINEQLGFLAGVRLRGRWEEASIPMSQDTALQWMLGRVANLPAGERIAAARELISELQAKGSKALAARALALAWRNSAASERLRSDQGLLPRWSADEAKALIAGMMNDATWEVASHRAFRRDLTDGEHLLINALIEEANPSNILDAIGGIDVTVAPESVLWDAIEASGQAHAIFMDALRKMLMMSEKLRCDSNPASLLTDLH